jgi:octaprenyl-diphosphate synthase
VTGLPIPAEFGPRARLDGGWIPTAMKTDASHPRAALQEILEPVRQDLERMETHLRGILGEHEGRVRELIEHVGNFRGKRLRPALVLLAARCCGDVTDEHLEVAAIVELIHTATLVHDDVLDEADMRRRLPTINRRYGNETAVLLGDYLFATAFSASAALEDRLASRYLSHITGVVCQGEIQQISERGNLDLDEKGYYEIISRKTASLYAAAARVGAAYAGADETTTTAFESYGMDLGLAFQIIDDCLDITGEEENVGKSLGTDFRQAKVTLPVIHFLRTAPEADRETMRRLAGEGGAALAEARRMLEEHGSLAHADEVACRHITAAAGHLDVVPPSPHRSALQSAAEYVLYRRR